MQVFDGPDTKHIVQRKKGNRDGFNQQQSPPTRLASAFERISNAGNQVYQNGNDTRNVICPADIVLGSTDLNDLKNALS